LDKLSQNQNTVEVFGPTATRHYRDEAENVASRYALAWLAYGKDCPSSVQGHWDNLKNAWRNGITEASLVAAWTAIRPHLSGNDDLKLAALIETTSNDLTGVR
jgi:hypothetical protein